MCLFSCGIVMIQAGIWETQPETSEKNMPNDRSATYSQSTDNHSDYSVLISSMEQHCATVLLLGVQG